MRLLDKFDHKGDDTPLRQLETSESDKAFTIAMNRLPYNWQRVMQMRNVENMSFAEIAAVLGTSESSVRGLLSKARTRMVEMINQQIR
jgi:RNA polymerase sigma-70 factor (ECF subfamily)